MLCDICVKITFFLRKRGLPQASASLSAERHFINWNGCMYVAVFGGGICVGYMSKFQQRKDTTGEQYSMVGMRSRLV